MNQEPIFILGAHKSGTSLLRNLFDGHTQLFVIPIETHFFQHNGLWIDYGIRRQFTSSLDENEIKDNYIKWIKYVNENADLYADSNTKGFWDIELLEQNLSNISGYNNLKKSIENFTESMYYALRSEKLSDNLRIIEKSVENAEYAVLLKKMFPKAKFIHIVRNPYSNITSIRKSKSQNGYPNLRRIMQSMYNSYYYLEKNQVLIDDDYFVLKYEDLVQYPNENVNKIIDFTNIRRDNILFRPTVNGEIWDGNSTTNKSFKGLSSEHLNRWTDEIEPIEINLINTCFKHILKRYGYEIIDKRNYFKLSKNEKIRTYLANRLLIKYL
ncbi:sulfotransferase [Virgibacillus sp. JSM 102003]|uniref:sulfotransferase family protein n=1 Tax=Virgibacillus sp. JSM 102003 TaxID=1562108 RepID=UPI0035C17BF8